MLYLNTNTLTSTELYEWEKEIDKIWYEYQDGKSIQQNRTPLSLVCDYFYFLKDLKDKDVLVVFNFDVWLFLKGLYKKGLLDYKSCTFLTDIYELNGVDDVVVIDFDKYKWNINLEDFMTIDKQEKNWPDTFDVIVGNPPFQDSKSTSDSIKLWSKITEKCLKLLKKGGYIGFVTPQQIVAHSHAKNAKQKPRKRIQKLLEQYSLLVYDATADKYFNVGIKICSWILQKIESDRPTKFIFDDKIVNQQYVANMNVNPTISDLIVDKFLSNENVDRHTRHRINYDSSIFKDMVDEPTSGYNNPVIWNTLTCKVKYTRQRVDTAHRLKLAMNSYKAFRDSEENMLITDKDVSHGYFYLSGNQEELLAYKKQFCTLKLFQYVSEHYKNSKGVYLIAQHQHVLPMLDINKDWTDQEVYRLFELTDLEIEEVERFCKIF